MYVRDRTIKRAAFSRFRNFRGSHLRRYITGNYSDDSYKEYLNLTQQSMYLMVLIQRLLIVKLIRI